MDSNQVWLTGYIGLEPWVDHEFHGNKYYKLIFNIFTRNIPVIVGQNVYDEMGDIDFGTMYEVDGEIRSRKEKDGRIEQYVHAKKVSKTESDEFVNEARICGQSKRPTKVRKTKDDRTIASMCINVGRANCDTRFDSVMCVGFREMADKAAEVPVGEIVEISGPIGVYNSKVNGAECIEVHISELKRG